MLCRHGHSSSTRAPAGDGRPTTPPAQQQARPHKAALLLQPPTDSVPKESTPKQKAAGPSANDASSAHHALPSAAAGHTHTHRLSQVPAGSSTQTHTLPQVPAGSSTQAEASEQAEQAKSDRKRAARGAAATTTHASASLPAVKVHKARATERHDADHTPAAELLRPMASAPASTSSEGDPSTSNSSSGSPAEALSPKSKLSGRGFSGRDLVSLAQQEEEIPLHWEAEELYDGCSALVPARKPRRSDVRLLGGISLTTIAEGLADDEGAC